MKNMFPLQKFVKNWHPKYETRTQSSLKLNISSKLLRRVFKSWNYLFILVSCDCNELGFLEDVSAERRVGKLHDVVGADQVETRLILVHRVQDCLKRWKVTFTILFIFYLTYLLINYANKKLKLHSISIRKMKLLWF